MIATDQGEDNPASTAQSATKKYAKGTVSKLTRFDTVTIGWGDSNPRKRRPLAAVARHMWIKTMASKPAFTFEFDLEQHRGTSPRQFVVYIGRRFKRADFAVTRGALNAMLPGASATDGEQLFAAAAGQIVRAVYLLHGQGLVTPGASIVIDRDNWRDCDVGQSAVSRPGKSATEDGTLKLRYAENEASSYCGRDLGATINVCPSAPPPIEYER